MRLTGVERIYDRMVIGASSYTSTHPNGRDCFDSELDWRCGGDVVSSESSFMVYNNIEIELFMRSCNCATESALPPLVPRSLTRR